jgi:hypothetical protein
LEEIVAAPVKKTENTTGGIRCADHATPSIRKSWHYFSNKRRSVGVVRSRIKATEFSFLVLVACVFVTAITFLPSRYQATIGGYTYRLMGGIY